MLSGDFLFVSFLNITFVNSINLPLNTRLKIELSKVVICSYTWFFSLLNKKATSLVFKALHLWVRVNTQLNLLVFIAL